MKQKAIICDLDGTLINSEHRTHFLNSEDKDKFYSDEEIAKDTMYPWCGSIIDRFDSKYDHMIIFLTGRREKHREQTIKTIRSFGIIQVFNCKNSLIMRHDNDDSRNHVFKELTYREQIEPFYDVLFCLEDDQNTVKMWRLLGLVCLDCGEMPDYKINQQEGNF